MAFYTKSLLVGGQLFKLCPRITSELQLAWNLSYSRIHGSAGRPKKMNEDAEDIGTKCYTPEEYFDTPPLLRRQSTFEDEQRIVHLLQEVLELRDKNVSSWIVENKVKLLVLSYKCLIQVHKEGFLKVLATNYSVNHEKVLEAINIFKDYEVGSMAMLKAEEQLKSLLTPNYSWLFKHVGRLERGVKFLVDLRTDVLDLISTMGANDEHLIPLQHLNNTLKDLLSLWFTVGFMSIERITWKSSCEMLQKISDYEAVHPVRSWADLKRRVGNYRRCYVYTHNSMPSEPLVVLHTALCTEIASSIRGIVMATQRMSVDAGGSFTGLLPENEEEDPCSVQAAIFYSITSTQKGLQGIELGNYLIKRVVKEIQAEFPNAHQFSSLSPIPTFKLWLLQKLKAMDREENQVILPVELWGPVLDKLNGSWMEISRVIHTNTWHTDHELMEAMKSPLMSACAYYLYKEKRRGSAYDSVANFHLRNGAVMWRLNWLADKSPKGMNNSCGMMVNYRYFLDDLENNSREYLENKQINASEQILDLVGERIPSKL